MILLLLASLPACTAPAGDSSVADPHDTGAPASATGDTPPPAAADRPLLTVPADAPDLDPAADQLHVSLSPHPAVVTVGDVQYEGYAYEGQVPGPTLRAAVGTSLTVDTTNGLDVETTIHWHGLHASAAMDGVTWMQDPIQPGESFTYTLPLDRAGTYWYHPHVDVAHQVDLGLYGAVVVADPAEDVGATDLLLVFDAWGEESLGEAADEHGLYMPSDLAWTVNGLVDPVVQAAPGERLRVRMINASNLAYLDLAWPGARRIADDQGLLGAPDEPERLLLAPGDRVEIDWTVPAADTDVATDMYVPAGGEAWGDPVRVLTVSPTGAAVTPAAGDYPFTGALPTADPGYTDITWVFQGGTGGEAWMINGEVWPDVTIQHAPLGQATVIEVRNLSATEHPFHLHGTPFEVLSVDGVPPETRTMEDTINVPIRGVARLRIVPDNAGDWAAHCHLLQHETGGMMTVLRVE